MDKKPILLILLFFCLVLFVLILVRAFSPVQMDDVNPQRFCQQKFLEKSDVLMVIPLLNNISIAENKTWCKSILDLNKTLGMHGVFHTPSEFSQLREESYVNQGREEFRKCFGYSPVIFEAPELKLSSENNKLLGSLGFEVRRYSYELFHKVYHCVDYEQTSYLVRLNRIIRFF